MSAIKIKVGDTVKVIAGKDKDKTGKVVAINKDANTAVVEGVNLVSKHTKPSMANQQGGIISQEAPISISNIMYVHKGQPTRLGYKVEDGKKVRIAKKTGEVID